MTFFTSAARKAQVGGIIAFLGPILTYLQATSEWDWRACAVAVVSGLIAGLSIYYTTNTPLPPVPQLRDRIHDQEAPR